jgi:hypothetical protein
VLARILHAVPVAWNYPIGFNPSYFSQTSAPTFDERRSEKMRGVSAIVEGHDGCVVSDRQLVAVPADDPSPSRDV